MSDYLSPLNSEQRAAVETLEGPLLVLAGAGTGKTRVLTTRFAHILMSQKARPWQVLTVTFTNKAAREMKERIATLLGQPVEGLWLGTFHSICARMLRKHAHELGLSNNFTILDTDDQLRLLKQVMEPYHLDTKRWPPAALMGIIQRWKDRALPPSRITPSEDSDFAAGKAAQIYKDYQARLLQLNACDFGDLLLHMVELFRTRPDILASYHELFRYILVDEYQDTNTIQYLWLRLLAMKTDGKSNICCVGDDDQSIYSWRGAEIENILRFEKDFEGAQIVRLESNYRSTPPILAAASQLIANNQGRLGKTLHSGRAALSLDAEKIRIVSAYDSDEEALIIGKDIERLHKEGHRLGEIAILMRAGFQTRSFEERLITLGLPYRVVGGVRFYERAEIRDGLAYLRIVQQPHDDLALERIINTPRRGVGTASMQKFHTHARAHQIPLLASIQQQLAASLIKGKMRNELLSLIEAIEKARRLSQTDGPVVAAEFILEESGYLNMWRTDPSLEAPGRLDNLKELLRAIAEFETLEGFLEHVSLVMENEENTDETGKVNLMTLHGAKGLEFDTVYLPGWEENIFPSQRTLEESGQAGLEEERRLAYVGLTRARLRVTITHAASRRIYGQWQPSLPSRFLAEIPTEFSEQISSTTLTRHLRLSAPSTRFDSRFGNNGFGGKSPHSNQPVIDITPSSLFSEGERVFHTKFGYGTITKIDAGQAEVIFDKAGVKHVLDRYLEHA